MQTDSKLKPFMIVGALLLAAWIAGMFYFGTRPAAPPAPEAAAEPAPKPVQYAHSNALPSARLREQAEQRAHAEDRDPSYGSGDDPAPSDDARGESPDPTTLD